MDKRYISLLLAVLVVSGAVYLPPQRTLAQPPAIQSPKKKVERGSRAAPWQTPAPFDEAVRKVHESLQIDSSRQPEDCADKACIQGEFLLATVPNPYSSPHRYVFDAYVESIQRAALPSGYVFDRYWFPWSEQHPPDGDTVEERRLQMDENRRLDEIPGVLVFRRYENHQWYPLVVFLISETPTSGVNKTAFLNAVHDARHLFGADKTSYIRILGPSFSGSIASLKIVMQNIAESYSGTHPVKFRLVTGAATATDNKERITPGLEDFSIQYDAVVADDGMTVYQFLEYLRSSRKIVGWSDVAIVSETGTAYGQGLREPTKRARGAFAFRDRHYPETGIEPLPIPGGISLLRNAYQDEPSLSATPQQGQVPPQTLRLNLRDPTTAKDLVPKFAPGQTAVSQETALLNILSTIRAKGIKFVGVALTDVLDNLFVARLIQKNCPDVRLFLLEPDLLFQHSEEGMSFAGTLMISTYPLFLQNQYWTRGVPPDPASPSPAIIQFPNQGANGVYNAGRVLLTEERETTSRKQYKPQLINYTWPLTATDTPPLWLTAVGRNGIWPIALLTGSRQPASSVLPVRQSPFEVPRPLERPSRPWSVGFLLVIVLVLAHNGFSIYHNWKPTVQHRNWFSSLKISSQPEFRQNQSFFLLFATLSLLSLYLAFALVMAGYFSHNSPRGKSCWLIAHAILAFLVAVTFVMTAIRCIAGLQIFWWWQQPFELLFAVASVEVLLFLVGWLCAVGHQLVSPKYAGLFFVFRSIHPGSGLAAFVPVTFLLAVFYLWAVTHLRRLKLSETRCPAIPAVFSDHDCVPKQLTGALDLTFCDCSETVIASVLFILTIFLSMPWRSLRSLEAANFDLFCSILMIIVYGFLLFTAVRFLTVWRRLKRLLHRLNWHPIGHIVARLPKDVSWLPMLHSGGMEQAEVTLARSRAKLSEMLASPGIDENLCQSLKAVEPGLNGRIVEFLRAKSCGMLDSADNFGELQRELKKISALLIANALMARWPNSDSTGLAADEKPSKREIVLPREEFERLAEEFVALRFVAFIRYVILQLRNFLIFLSVAFLLAVVSFNSYPFQPHHTLTTFLTVVFFVWATFVVIAFLQMGRDPVLRRLSSQGKLSGAVMWRAISFGGLPLITILASQFPTLGRFLFSWVQPALEAVR